ncbi:MAG TPA: FAD-binding and (Fe-S)-binding domain-containing protein [Burkholderiales bacterium]|nr:FAD-binding and (Fe-S)-binding domain-containing protein [Burkholderiales bacterium]
MQESLQVVEFQRLEAALRHALSGEVRFDKGMRAAYAADASNYRQVPIGVVLPRSVEDIVETLRLCSSHGAPVLARGGATSLNGQAVNVAVVIDCSKYLDRVLSIDARARLARAEPGVVCDTLRDAAEAHGLTFAPDPATHSRCTLGGMIGNNSCGPHSVMAGTTVDNIERLEVITYDGTRFWCGPTSDSDFQKIVSQNNSQSRIYRKLKAIADKYADHIRAGFPKIKRRVSGYNLDQLLPENGFNVARALVGSEGTCALTLQAEARLVKSPRERVLVVLGFPDIGAAGDAVPRILAARPIACEGLDEAIIGGLRERRLRLDDIALLPPGKAWLMVEFGADTREEAVLRASSLNGSVISDKATVSRLWTIRETGASATALNLGAKGADPVVGWEDAAVDPMRLGDYLREFQALVERFGYRTSLYGHFGDGCIHARINFELRTPAGLAHWRRFLTEAAILVVKYGGSLSGEHGDGQAKGELLPIMFGPELMQAFREFKRAWDPLNRMNPGKLIDARPFDADLRLGPEYKPVTLQTRMFFGSEVGDGFTRAAEHCIGMGKCRSSAGGTMCPSYRGTREERYSTRGRARLLAEMLRGEVITEGWASTEVQEALDWCLACKGCRSDCPTHTDMAAYKAEFLSHYYETHSRPRQAFTMGRIGEWAPLASLFSGFTNIVSDFRLAKVLAGVAPDRALPRFAARTFRSKFKANSPGAGAGDAVVLFDDTFNNHFRPGTAVAAQKLLEAAGCAVELPARRVCCGRPYYDYGMLDEAKRALQRVLEVLPMDRPIVVLEPGCLSVFRDELGKLLPDDARAARLASQATSLSELLNKRDFGAKASGRVFMHGHCHQKALWGSGADLQLLKRSGCEVLAPDTGCCGMAGSFGYRPEHAETSRRIAGLELLPALEAARDAVVVANGFSCREQIETLGGRATLHIAEFLSG